MDKALSEEKLSIPVNRVMAPVSGDLFPAVSRQFELILVPCYIATFFGNPLVLVNVDLFLAISQQIGLGLLLGFLPEFVNAIQSCSFLDLIHLHQAFLDFV